MADMDLRKRLAAAAGLAIDDRTLDTIYERLMNVEKGSIPVTVKYVFSVTEEGQLEVDVSAKCDMVLQKFTLQLKSDGKQLKLAMDDSPPLPMEPPAPEEKPRRRTTRAKVADLGDPAFTPPKPEPDSDRVRSRIAELKSQAERLYREKRITMAQAKMAGVDTDAIDAVR